VHVGIDGHEPCMWDAVGEAIRDGAVCDEDDGDGGRMNF